jgi:DNA-binding response OmpR family regulator
MNEHVLVVDDDEAIRLLLQELLESEMYIVDTASDGLMALDKITRRAAGYQAILLDLNMPGMNGLQVIQHLQHTQHLSLHAIAALSADHSALQRAASLGIGQCLIKPFDLETLLAFVRSCKTPRLEAS